MQTVAVDWSGAKDPRRHQWLARARDSQLLQLRSGLSREEAVHTLIELSESSSEPLVIGMDFSFSLPAWFLERLGLRTARQLWELVDRVGESWLESCERPFWGRPGKTRPELEEHFRRTEAACERVAGIGPKSTFQIGGAGSVGTSSIRGMPFLARLQDAGFAIWPFDPPNFPIVLEIYPRLFTGPVVKSNQTEREQYLGRIQGITPGSELARVAASSEDAFDAAVSAVMMSRHAAELAHLWSVEDPLSLLEGEIWAPAIVMHEQAG